MALNLKYQDQNISVGDTVKVHQAIKDNDKTRTQIFEGIVIAIRNRGQGQSITVRKIGANSIGVEKILPVHLPDIKKIQIKRKGSVRRSKLYYLRDKIGKAATRIKEKKANIQTTKKA